MNVNTYKLDAANTYPTNLPNPTRQLSGTIDYGVLRSQEQGFPDQGRTNGANTTIMSLAFQLTLDEYHQFSEFMNNNTGSWIALPVVNQYPFILGDITPVVHDTVRLASTITASPLGAGHMFVQAQFETLPRDIHDATAGAGGDVVDPPDATVSDWIVAKTPGGPSVDIIIAGDPASPSADLIDSRSPADHK